MQSKPLALVTGAYRGIGLEVSRQLAQRGFSVLLTGRDATKGAAAAQDLAGQGLDVQFRHLDVANDLSVRELAAEVEREFGRLDVLVNNAAAMADWSETVSSANLADVHALFETNVFGAWRTIQVFLPLLRKSAHPRIVNVSSGAGAYEDPQFGLKTNNGRTASYGISKAALTALTIKAAAELAGTGVLINAVCPGLTATAPGMEDFGARPIPDGASGIVWAATLPDDGPSGGFFRDGQRMPW